jgi:hypothetical protein
MHPEGIYHKVSATLVESLNVDEDDVTPVAIEAKLASAAPGQFDAATCIRDDGSD